MRIENHIWHEGKNNMKIITKNMNNKENIMIKMYEIEKMIVEALEEYLKSIEKIMVT